MNVGSPVKRYAASGAIVPLATALLISDRIAEDALPSSFAAATRDIILAKKLAVDEASGATFAKMSATSSVHDIIASAHSALTYRRVAVVAESLTARNLAICS
jgi:hypothetical protein